MVYGDVDVMAVVLREIRGGEKRAHAFIFWRGVESTISFTHPFLYLPVGEPRSSTTHKRSCVSSVWPHPKVQKKHVSAALVLKALQIRITENGPMDRVFLGWSPIPAKIFTFNYIANNDGNNDRYYQIGVI